MNLVAMDIPDDPARLAGWLERHLVGLDLAALVAELAAAHGAAPDRSGTLRTLLGSRLEQVRTAGLAKLSAADLKQLLRHPHALLELQDFVLSEGGPYWAARSQDADLGGLIEAGNRRLGDFLSEQTATHDVATLKFRPKTRWYRNPFVVALAAAAAVLGTVRLAPHLVGLEVIQPVQPVNPDQPDPVVAKANGWGWAKDGALPEDGTAKEYFTKLADAGQEWFNKQPDDAAGVAKRIGEFRQGCTTLLLAQHRPLPDTEKRWLLERCHKWAEKIDQTLVALEHGQIEAKDARHEMDVTAKKLVDALRSRADSV